MIPSMARKSYTDDFRRQAVDLYESTEGATLSGIASDLGIARGTLADWVATFGSAAKTATGAAPTTSPSMPLSPGSGRSDSGRAESQAAKLARLEARVRELEAETTKLATEREILRSAAKYFAGETNW
jgi:transposase